MHITRRRNSLCIFFFQAEDGIRDYKVTGVQTCALPISLYAAEGTANVISQLEKDDVEAVGLVKFDFLGLTTLRSEERRVGKSVDLGGRRIIKKKKKRKL